MKPPLDSELHALIDRRLSPQQAAETEQRLAHHPEEAARVRDWRRQKEALHAAFDGWLETPVPAHLQRAARRTPQWRYGMAAALAGLVLGGVVGYSVRGLWPVSSPLLAERNYATKLRTQATLAHVTYSPEVRHPVEVAASQEAHLVQWLSKRLGHAVAIPHLQAQGFELVGGRLLPAGPAPAAQFMYQDARQQRLTLYVRPSEGNRETAFRFAREGAVSVFYWVDGPFGYALSGSMPREELLAAAEAAYHQLARPEQHQAQPR
ncbi:anti-sigma factor [Imbroritus primus]|uniref:Anti-sigma factor n=1 Tax=Imbroritus primus TaxID=3058603 RepID=A0ACD3SQ19_9BURK|nr:anti-sigma factor [Burkholderiaceae bacterium PBA]